MANEDYSFTVRINPNEHNQLVMTICYRDLIQKALLVALYNHECDTHGLDEDGNFTITFKMP